VRRAAHRHPAPLVRLGQTGLTESDEAGGVVDARDLGLPEAWTHQPFLTGDEECAIKEPSVCRLAGGIVGQPGGAALNVEASVDHVLALQVRGGEEHVATVAHAHLDGHGALLRLHGQSLHAGDVWLAQEALVDGDEGGLEVLTGAAADHPLELLRELRSALGRAVAGVHGLVLRHEVGAQHRAAHVVLREELRITVHLPLHPGSCVCTGLPGGFLNVVQPLERAALVMVVVVAVLAVLELLVVVEDAVGHVGPGERALGSRRAEREARGELRLGTVHQPVMLLPAIDAEDVHGVGMLGTGVDEEHGAAVVLDPAGIGGEIGDLGHLADPARMEGHQLPSSQLGARGVHHAGVMNHGVREEAEAARVVGIGGLGIAEVRCQRLLVAVQVEVQKVEVGMADVVAVVEREAEAAVRCACLEREEPQAGQQTAGDPGVLLHRTGLLDDRLAHIWGKQITAELGGSSGLHHRLRLLWKAHVGPGTLLVRSAGAEASGEHVVRITERGGVPPDAEHVDGRRVHALQALLLPEVHAVIEQQVGDVGQVLHPAAVVRGGLEGDAVPVQQVHQHVAEAGVRVGGRRDVVLEHPVHDLRGIGATGLGVERECHQERGLLVHPPVALDDVRATDDVIRHHSQQTVLDMALQSDRIEARKLLEPLVLSQRREDGVIGQGSLLHCPGLPGVVQQAPLVAGVHLLPVAGLLLVLVVRVVHRQLPQEQGALVGIPSVTGDDIRRREVLQSRVQVVTHQPVGIVRDEPVLELVAGCLLVAPAIVHVLAGQQRLVLHAALEVGIEVIARVGLAAHRARDLVRVLEVHLPAVHAGDLEHLLPMDGALRCADDAGPRDRWRRHEVAEALVIHGHPAVGPLDDAVPFLLRPFVALEVFAHAGEAGVGVVVAGCLGVYRGHQARTSDKQQEQVRSSQGGHVLSRERRCEGAGGGFLREDRTSFPVWGGRRRAGREGSVMCARRWAVEACRSGRSIPQGGRRQRRTACRSRRSIHGRRGSRHMRRRQSMRIALTCAMVVVVSVSIAEPLSEAEQRWWLRHVIPLPRQAEIIDTRQLPANGVAVCVAPGASDVTQAGAALLAAALKTQVASEGPAGSFRLLVGTCDDTGKMGDLVVPQAVGLSELKNSDQAYVIVRLGPDEMVLTGLTERGVYYACLTMAQLAGWQVREDGLTLPVVSITDWPDLQERGEWGGNCASDIEWMSARKMNLAEVHCNLQVTDEGTGVASMPPELLEEGRLHAFKIVPIITHLDQLAGSGIFRVHPDVIGQGESAHLRGHETVIAPCFSDPRMLAILTDWMVCLGKQTNVTDVCCWLSENSVQCGCEQCKQIPQHVLETRTLVKAYHEAVKQCPSLRMRVLLTQGSYAHNDQVLAEAPPDVGISYYDGGRTYDSSRDPMIYPLLEQFAASGRWLGVYPQVTASWRIVCPWSGPQFMKYRMTEFVDKGLSNLTAYATPNNRLYDFNVTAGAEWGWNAHGRDEREFATAWAIGRGIRDAEKAAEWAMTLGPVGWDVYGSGVPFNAYFGAAARLIQSRVAPKLGTGMFRYFPDERRFADDQAACAKAAALAQVLGFDEITAETQVITGYLTMIQKQYELAKWVSAPQAPTDEQRLMMRDTLTAFSEASQSVSAGLAAWEKACVGAGVGGRLADTVDVTEQTAAGVAAALAPFGIRDPYAPYLRQKIGEYVDGDFEDKQSIRKVWDVTARISGPGVYAALFYHIQGWNGATVQRVALASAPKGQPDQLTELAVDEHQGVIGYTPRDPQYRLELKQYDPALTYYVVVNMSGVKSSDKPIDRRGCHGAANLWKEKAPGEKPEPLPLEPMAEAEKARFGMPKFTKAGVRVGVLQGGYGSQSVLAYLQGKGGVDAQALYSLEPASLKDVQVLVLPQSHTPDGFTAQMAEAARGFLANGGGLIALHDAVGFRGLPVLGEEVCAGGLSHARDTGWVLKVDHPLCVGLPRDRALTQSYYDHVTLAPGPKGTVVAVGATNEVPMLVCGGSGKGRYVAWGLAIGISKDDDSDIPPTADEGLLLENAIRWCAGEK